MKWTTEFEEIIKYNKDNIHQFDFDRETAEFLIQYGLPKDAAPFLSFATSSLSEGISKLTDIYDFLAPEYERYIVIGSNGSGDQVVVDLRDDCKIKLLDHENNFSEQLINSNINRLSTSLKIYQNFVHQVLFNYGEDGLLECKYSLEDIEKLQNQLTRNDRDSMNEECMWWEEMELLKANIEIR